MTDSPLFEDVKTAARFSSALAVPDTQYAHPTRPEVSALERGRRHRPDGTVEEYERVEFERG